MKILFRFVLTNLAIYICLNWKGNQIIWIMNTKARRNTWKKMQSSYDLSLIFPSLILNLAT